MKSWSLTFYTYLNIICSFVLSIEHEEAEIQILLCSPSKNREGAHANTQT